MSGRQLKLCNAVVRDEEDRNSRSHSALIIHSRSGNFVHIHYRSFVPDANKRTRVAETDSNFPSCSLVVALVEPADIASGLQDVQRAAPQLLSVMSWISKCF